jgi:thioredoxin reductase
VAVLTHGKNAAAFTAHLLTWTTKLTLLTDQRNISRRDRAALEKLDVAIRTDAVVALEGNESTGQLERVLFSEGEPLECDALFFNLGAELATDFHETLGCRLDDESGLVWIDKTQQTSINGVYAAGDMTPRSQLAIVAAAEGAMAAIQIHRSLTPEERRV